MDQAQARALEALQPFLSLTTSSMASSPRFVAEIITNATSNPNTFVFAELLEQPAVQALGKPDAPEEFRRYLKLLEIFAWGTWQDYRTTPGLPSLNEAQTLKLRLLSLLTLARTLRPLTYESLMSALEISTTSELESLVTTAIYSSLITARLSPTSSPPAVNVTAVAPLRDVHPQTVSTMISILSEWESRCGDVIGSIETEIAKIKAQAAEQRKRGRDRAKRIEKSINGWKGLSLEESQALRRAVHQQQHLKSGSARAAGKAASGTAAGSSASSGQKREFNGDDDDDVGRGEDDGYFERDSDADGSSRMDIDEGAGAQSSSTATRQAKRILNMGKKT